MLFPLEVYIEFHLIFLLERLELSSHLIITFL
jgi:hypothetical protein